MELTDDILGEEALKNKLEIKQRSKIKQFLDDNNIKYFLKSNGTVITSMSAFNNALLGNIKDHENEEIQFDF